MLGDDNNHSSCSTLAQGSPLMMASENQSVPNSPQQPFSLSLTASGPYREPANIELIAHATHPEKLTNITFYWNNQTKPIGNVVEEPYECDVTRSLNRLLARRMFFLNFNFSGMLPSGGLAAGEQQFKAVATYENGEQAVATLMINILPSNQYKRGLSPWISYTPTIFSTIEALDFEDGVFLDDRPPYLNYSSNGIDADNNFAKLYPQGYPWFLRTATDSNAPKEPCYHLYVDEKENVSYRKVNEIPVLRGEITGDAPPLVDFGQAGGGKELFVSQSYRFGINAGGQCRNLFNKADIKIEVYDKEQFSQGANNVAPIYTQKISLPRRDDINGWNQFNNEGFNREVRIFEPYGSKTIDFETQIQYVPEFETWGNWEDYSFILTHRAGSDAFYFKVSVMGGTSMGITPNLIDMAQNAAGTASAYNLSYTLDFNTPASWSATFLNQPHFQGVALPSFYQGKSVDELLHETKPVRDNLPSPLSMRYNLASIGYNLMALDNSPELKSHPELDRIVTDYGKDPIALANYVLNEIELTDAIGYNVTGQINDTSINPQGVSRDALGTYLEGQGSPAEQCALLIYLLRKAGYSAAYVFPQHNGTLLFDEQLSKLLQIQVRGIKDAYGNTANQVPELIPVNYPWVAAYIDGKWVYLFPWLKDTSVMEGKNIWNYFPSGYNNGTQWLTHYLLNDPTLRSLSTKDNLGTLFTIYTKNKLADAGLTLDDVGMQIFNHRHYYTSWDEFPRPWQTPLISQENLAQNLDVNQNEPALKSALKDIFDTIEITVFSDRGGRSKLHPGSNIIHDPAPGDPTISTGPLRMVDLHNRRLLLRHKSIPQLVINNGQIMMADIGLKMILTLEAYDSSPSSKDRESHSFYIRDPNSWLDPDPGNLRSRQEAHVDLQTTNDSDNDNQLWYNIIHRRHRQAQTIETALNGEQGLYPNQFPGVGEETLIEDCRPLLKGDMAVLNLNYGRVTPKMQEFEARKYWNYQQYVATHPKDDIDPELATG